MNDRNLHHKTILDEWLIKYEKTINTIIDQNNINSFLDIGANTGAVIEFILSRHALKNVYAFEPDIENFQILSRHVSQILSSNTHYELFNKAVYYGLEKVKVFGCNDGNPGGMFIENVNKEFANNIGSEISNQVFYCATLEESLAHVDKIDLCKIDVEGSEWNIIENSTFVKEKTNNILLEYHWVDEKRALMLVERHLPQHQVVDVIHNTIVMKKNKYK